MAAKATQPTAAAPAAVNHDWTSTDTERFNQYGCTACPQCGDHHRGVFRGLVECSECGFKEPVRRPPGLGGEEE